MSAAAVGSGGPGNPTASGRTRDPAVFSPLYWDDGVVVLLDQRLLPQEERWVRFEDAAQVAEAIRTMVVRGAPAIGCAAALGLAAAARRFPNNATAFRRAFENACETLAGSRPTAVNLFWAIARQRAVVERTLAGGDTGSVQAALEAEALAIWREDIAHCRSIGKVGAALLPQRATVLTHCNAGALATGGYGTALGVVRGAVASGKQVRVFAGETRPYLQGARLTTWELMRDGIDVTLICDNTAGTLFARREITCCVVGADRIANNGDVANKIGTYSLAVLAHHHGVPFYVAAPRSTIDRATETGAQIPIEQRAASEVTQIDSHPIAPPAVQVHYPAFDVTPAELITAIITEVGIAQPPTRISLGQLFEKT